MEKFLKLNVKAEPLIWKWYAWPYLIPPVQAGCNIVERHLKIMKSYVQFPKIHKQAIKNPKLMGGPFLDLDEKYLGLVKDLILETENICKSYISLNNDFKYFQNILQQEAVGNSLEPFYNRLPDSLNGLVELVYDSYNHPQILLLEKLIYQRYYDDQHQCISLSLLDSDTYPFIMSTPRVVKQNEVHVSVPFVDKLWDEFFQSKYKPISVSKWAEKFGIKDPKSLEQFESMFTEFPNVLSHDRHYNGTGVRVRYFGHATILLQTDKLSIITDPILSYHIPEQSRYSYQDLPDRLDYVLLTHNHQDHVMIETLLQIRHKIDTIIVPRNNKGALEDPSLKLILNQIGFYNVIDIDNLESIHITDGEIMGIPFLGEHSDLNIQSKTAHFLKLKNKKFLLAADSNNLSTKMYELIFDYFGGIDVLFLGMECDGAPLSWLYGPFLNQPLNRTWDDERTLSGSNFKKAWALAQASQCKQAYVYAMGMEPWLTYIMALKYQPDSIQIMESDRFVKTCRDNGILSERLYIKKEWVVE